MLRPVRRFQLLADIMVLILQWNARSLVANGQEFKQFINSLPIAPDVLCIQETWLTLNLDFRINNYIRVRGDRENGIGGGCATFIKRNIPYQVIAKGREEEYIIIKIWTNQGQLSVINYYNPCRKLVFDKLCQIVGKVGNQIFYVVILMLIVHYGEEEKLI